MPLSRQRVLRAVCLSALMALLLMTVRPSTCRSAETNALGMTFVRIAAGSFRMGSPTYEPYRDASEKPLTVTLTEPFYLQTTEVTVGQWQAVMGRSMLRRRTDTSLPVTRVSWFDVHSFITKLNAKGLGRYRLPTEAEWEYAARAGTDTAYPWGEAIECQHARYESSRKYSSCADHARSRGLPEYGPAPVGRFPPNPWGLYDMHGNVWEWCQDWLADYPQSSAVDPRGPDRGEMKVRRGGSWYAYGKYCRSANRAGAHPASRLRTTGFRLVRVSP